jgi:hypothetical protein
MENPQIGDQVFFRDHRAPEYSARGRIEAIGDSSVLDYHIRIRLYNGKAVWASEAELRKIKQ